MRVLVTTIERPCRVIRLDDCNRGRPWMFCVRDPLADTDKESTKHEDCKALHCLKIWWVILWSSISFRAMPTIRPCLQWLSMIKCSQDWRRSAHWTGVHLCWLLFWRRKQHEKKRSQNCRHTRLNFVSFPNRARPQQFSQRCYNKCQAKIKSR